MFRISHRLFYFYRTNFAVFSAVFLSSDDLIGLDLKVIFFPGFQFLPGQFCGVRLFDRLRPLPVFLLSDCVGNLISGHAFDLLPLQHCFFIFFSLPSVKISLFTFVCVYILFCRIPLFNPKLYGSYSSDRRSKIRTAWD